MSIYDINFDIFASFNNIEEIFYTVNFLDILCVLSNAALMLFISFIAISYNNYEFVT